jgi:hypothetical protein
MEMDTLDTLEDTSDIESIKSIDFWRDERPLHRLKSSSKLISNVIDPITIISETIKSNEKKLKDSLENPEMIYDRERDEMIKFPEDVRQSKYKIIRPCYFYSGNGKLLTYYDESIRSLIAKEMRRLRNTKGSQNKSE